MYPHPLRTPQVLVMGAAMRRAARYLLLRFGREHLPMLWPWVSQSATDPNHRGRAPMIKTWGVTYSDIVNLNSPSRVRAVRI